MLPPGRSGSGEPANTTKKGKQKRLHQAEAARRDNDALHHRVEKLFSAIDGIEDTNTSQSKQTPGVAESATVMNTVITKLGNSLEMIHSAVHKLKQLTGQFRLPKTVEPVQSGRGAGSGPAPLIFRA